MSQNLTSNIKSSPQIVGILAFQGAFDAHRIVCLSLGCPCLEIRHPTEISRCSHIIIPGGESTVFLKLLEFNNIASAIQEHVRKAKPVLATCAGLILLARQIINSRQQSLDLLNVSVERNAYGRQVNSFETQLDIPLLGEEPFHGIFIRAPIIKETGKGVEILARHRDHPVFIKQGKILATTFHPELADDPRLHQYFLSLS